MPEQVSLDLQSRKSSLGESRGCMEQLKPRYPGGSTEKGESPADWTRAMKKLVKIVRKLREKLGSFYKAQTGQ